MVLPGPTSQNPDQQRRPGDAPSPTGYDSTTMNLRTQPSRHFLAVSLYTLRAFLLIVAGIPLLACSGKGTSQTATPPDNSPPPVVQPEEPPDIVPPPPVGKPNIVLILTDDQNVGFEPYMEKLRSELIAKGAWFENSFVTTSLCCPSRVSLLTGQYAHNHGVLSNNDRGGYPLFLRGAANTSNLGVWLQSAGYRTGLVGKFLNMYPLPPTSSTPLEPTVPPGWNDWFAAVDTVNAPTPYRQYDYRMVDNGTFRDYGANEADYFGDVVTARALEFIDKAVADEAPFFLFVNYISPHAPEVAAPRHKDNPRTGVEVPNKAMGSYNEEDVSDKPQWVQLNPRLSPAQLADLDRIYRGRVNSLQSVDEAIGRFIERLEALAVLRNTYVIFTSDNGFHYAHHRVFRNKNTAYEENIRVPLAIRGPAIPYGLSSAAFALNIDLAPTILDLAGVTGPDTIDGRSLKALWESERAGAAANWRNAFLVEHFSPRTSDIGKPNKDPYFLEYSALRERNSIYVDYAYSDREYYQLEHDPYQLQNAVNTAAPATMATMATRLDEMRNCSGASCRAIETR